MAASYKNFKDLCDYIKKVTVYKLIIYRPRLIKTKSMLKKIYHAINIEFRITFINSMKNQQFNLKIILIILITI